MCIDDVGLHPGIDAAAIDLVQRGRVQAITCMVGAPAFADGAAALRSLIAARPNQPLEVGLHLDLTEHPLPLASTMPPMPPMSLRTLILKAYLRALDRPALRAQIRAQLDAFEDRLGCPPDFIDGHQHVHQLPIVRTELLAELQGRGWRQRPWLRSTRSARRGWDKAALIQQLGAGRLMALCDRHGYAHNRALLGVYDFRGGMPRYEALLDDWLQRAHDGDLLMCHPGTQLPRDVGLGGARQAEYDVLRGPRFAEAVHRQGIALAPMSRWLAKAGDRSV